MRRSNFVTLGKFLFVLSLLALPTISFSQTSVVRKDAYLVRQLDSKLMGRKINYGVLLPANYEAGASTGRRYPVLYLLHGLTGHFDNWFEKSAILDHIKDRDVIVVAAEGEDGWYTDSQANERDKYESYIIKELIPEIDAKYRTLARRDSRFIAGLSMGGYGAIKFGLKYPEMFSVVGSFSGAIGAATITEKTFPGSIGKTIDSILGPSDSATRKANDPFEIIRGTTPDKIKSYPFIYLDCGSEDFLFPNNREFVSLLVEKKVPHEFRQLPGGHTWTYWDQQVKEFIQSIPRLSNYTSR